jgi:hypothetical protein
MAWRWPDRRADFGNQRGAIPARFFLIAITVLAYLGVILLLLLSAEQAAT